MEVSGVCRHRNSLSKAHLLELVLVLLLVHVLLGAHLGCDLRRNDHVELIARRRIAHEHHVQQLPLIVRDDRVQNLRWRKASEGVTARLVNFGYNLARVLMYVDQQASKVVKRDAMLVVSHHRLDSQTTQNKLHREETETDRVLSI